jgi:hypothetical protein
VYMSDIYKRMVGIIQITRMQSDQTRGVRKLFIITRTHINR